MYNLLYLWFAMLTVSVTALFNFIVNLYLISIALDFLGLSKLFNSISLLISTNKEASEIVANNYFLIIMVIFPASYFSFRRVIKWLSKMKYLRKIILFYNNHKDLSIAYYTVILVFFGFLPLFLNLLVLQPTELQQLNNMFFLVSLGSIFPYFTLVIMEAKERMLDTNSKDNNFEAESKATKNYDNIYFVLSVIFLIFIFILIFFMYQQNFNWDAENIGNVISTLGIIGTFAAASAAAWAAITAKNSFIEQSAANERAVKPHLTLQNKRYEVDVIDKQHPFLFNWDNGLKITNSNKIENYSFLKISNISSGIARKVVVKVEIKDYMSIVDKLNNHPSKSKQLIEIKNITHKDGSPMLEVFSNVQSKFSLFSDISKLELREKIETFTALGVKDEDAVLVRMPKAFIILNNIFMSNYFRFEDVIYLPYLEIEVSCESIQEKEYSFKYQILIDSLNYTEDIMSGDRNYQFNLKVIEE